MKFDLYDYKICYTFDIADKKFIAREAEYYRLPRDKDGFILWYQNSVVAGANKLVPIDSAEYLKFIRHLNPDMKIEDAIRVLELRHLGLWSSYKNLLAKNVTWVGKFIYMLETELANTTELIYYFRDMLKDKDINRYRNMKNTNWRDSFIGFSKWFE